MNEEIKTMQYLLIYIKAVRGVYLPGQVYWGKELVRLAQRLLHSYYTIKRYWEETRE